MDSVQYDGCVVINYCLGGQISKTLELHAGNSIIIDLVDHYNISFTLFCQYVSCPISTSTVRDVHWVDPNRPTR
jgi:hypothetical protein